MLRTLQRTTFCISYNTFKIFKPLRFSSTFNSERPDDQKNDHKNNNFTRNIKYGIVVIGIAVTSIFINRENVKKIIMNVTDDTPEIYNITQEQYKKLYPIISKFLSDRTYVYTSCIENNSNWLIILKRTPNTLTDENRKCIKNAAMAKYIGTYLEVIMIVNIDDATVTLNEVKDNNNNFSYTVGEVINKKEKDNANNNIYAYGVPFFLNIFRAISHTQNPKEKFSGIWIFHHADGQRLKYAFYHNGVHHGECKLYYNNGMITERMQYHNGILNGQYFRYHFGEKIHENVNYINGNMHGLYVCCYENGQVCKKINYDNGVMDGPYEGYEPSGYRTEKVHYYKGKRHSALYLDEACSYCWHD
jgi:antitoxin component YwqK of YwqJK toxin-antitoxin module